MNTTTIRLFRGVRVDDDGGATVSGVHYEKSYVDAALEEERCCPMCGSALAARDASPQQERRP